MSAVQMLHAYCFQFTLKKKISKEDLYLACLSNVCYVPVMDLFMNKS